jgi:hypothetical protein|tara:strand:+ start:2487 stop:2729 length:243 start_codon:yes stop_codon:yes gene_type:complete
MAGPKNEPGCPPHHYLIELARGKESLGVCQKCGDARTFQNSPDTLYGKNYARKNKPGAGVQRQQANAEALQRALEAEREE